MIKIYFIKIRECLDKILAKLEKKDKTRYEQIIKKIEENKTSDDVDHYKNLRSPLQHLKGVHIGPFVLVFSVDKSSKTIIFENYKHHDEIYKNPF